MTPVEDQLPRLLDHAAPRSAGVDPVEVVRMGRRLRRRRLATATGAVTVSVAAAAAITVIAISGSSNQSTVSPVPIAEAQVTTVLTPTSAATTDELHQAAAVLTRRLASAGIEGQVQVGNKSISLRLPASAARSARYLTGTGNLDFRVPSIAKPAPTTPATTSNGCVSASAPAAGDPPPCITARLSSACPKPGTAEAQRVADAAADDWIVACDTSGTVMYALSPERLGGDAVASATTTTESGAAGTSTGRWIVTIDFAPSGQRAWTDLTSSISSTPGCPVSAAPECSVAIVVDGVVQSAPIIQDRIPGPAQVTGSFTEQAAKALAAALNSGPLPVPLSARAS